MEDNRQSHRPNRHSNPSKGHLRKQKGRLMFFRKKNRGVREIFAAMA